MSRREELRNEIKLDDNLYIEEKKSIKKLLSEYEDIFFIEGDKLSHTDAIKHSMVLLSLV